MTKTITILLTSKFKVQWVVVQVLSSNTSIVRFTGLFLEHHHFCDDVSPEGGSYYAHILLFFLWPKDWCVLQDHYWFLAKVNSLVECPSFFSGRVIAVLKPLV